MLSHKIPDFYLSGFEKNCKPDIVPKKTDGPLKYQTPGNPILHSKYLTITDAERVKE